MGAKGSKGARDSAGLTLPAKDAGAPMKILLTGDSLSGKSTLIHAFIELCSGVSASKRIDEDYSELVLKEPVALTLQLWDPPETKQKRLSAGQYAKYDGILVVFDVSSKDSFESAREYWLEQITCYAPHVPVVLIGNKKDLPAREVSEKDALGAAKEKGARGYVESSATTGPGVRDAFLLLGEEVLQQREVAATGTSASSKKKKKGTVKNAKVRRGSQRFADSGVKDALPANFSEELPKRLQEAQAARRGSFSGAKMAQVQGVARQGSMSGEGSPMAGYANPQEGNYQPPAGAGGGGYQAPAKARSSYSSPPNKGGGGGGNGGGPIAEEFKKEAYWLPKGSRTQAEDLLQPFLEGPETVLCRPSSKAGAYALSYTKEGRIYHTPVTVDGNMYFFHDWDNKRRDFRTMGEIVEFLELTKYRGK